jgi:hypothetical protein
MVGEQHRHEGQRRVFELNLRVRRSTADDGRRVVEVQVDVALVPA